MLIVTKFQLYQTKVNGKENIVPQNLQLHYLCLDLNKVILKKTFGPDIDAVLGMSVYNSSMSQIFKYNRYSSSKLRSSWRGFTPSVVFISTSFSRCHSRCYAFCDEELLSFRVLCLVFIERAHVSSKERFTSIRDYKDIQRI